MYADKLAVAIKSNGKVLREFKDTVYIPFGSEYSILVKNLNSVRALVNITLDGDDVVPGGLVIDANCEIDLERWIKNGNLTEGNRFKFIERTAGIEQHRGIKLDDGIIRIEYQFEHVYQTRTLLGTWRNDGPMYSKGILRSSDTGTGPHGMVGSVTCNSVFTASAGMSQNAIPTATYNDAGITVAGSKSEQKFSTASWFPTDTTKHAMVIKLLGETPDNKPVLQPVTVKTKQKCVTCNHTNKATSSFCSRCGTALEIFA